jgi:NAD+ diphosphatase
LLARKDGRLYRPFVPLCENRADSILVGSEGTDHRAARLVRRLAAVSTSRDSIYRRYVPSLEPDGNGRPGYWFVFADGKLLLRNDGDNWAVPFAREAGQLGVSPVRVQYLGTLDDQPSFSAEVTPDAAAPTGMAFTELRACYGLVPEDMYLLAGRALQIVSWDQTNQFCGRCGAGTSPLKGERAKKCPRCGLITYPRLSPAVITAVVKGDQILLARRAGTRVPMFSVLAGFVEPGETLEDCLKREVLEEVGIRVKNIKYFSSQPWPYPNSLMIGFTAEHESGEIEVDGIEVSEARWYSASSLPNIPPKFTIARDLIDWFVEQWRG